MAFIIHITCICLVSREKNATGVKPSWLTQGLFLETEGFPQRL